MEYQHCFDLVNLLICQVVWQNETNRFLAAGKAVVVNDSRMSVSKDEGSHDLMISEVSKADGQLYRCAISIKTKKGIQMFQKLIKLKLVAGQCIAYSLVWFYYLFVFFFFILNLCRVSHKKLNRDQCDTHYTVSTGLHRELYKVPYAYQGGNLFTWTAGVLCCSTKIVELIAIRTAVL